MSAYGLSNSLPVRSRSSWWTVPVNSLRACEFEAIVCRNAKFIEYSTHIESSIRFLSAFVIFRYKNHSSLRVEVHQSSITSPGNHGLEGFFRIVIRQGAADVLDDTHRFHFFILFKQSDD